MSTAERVLLVMRRPGNVRVMQQALASIAMGGIGVGDEEALSILLDATPAPCLALVDVSGFGGAAWRMCATLRTRKVPFVVISSPEDMISGDASAGCGAVGLLQKPIARSALLQIVRGVTGVAAQA